MGFLPERLISRVKFNEMTYTRPDIDALLAVQELAAKPFIPGTAMPVRLYYEQGEAFAEYNTAANLASIPLHHTTLTGRPSRTSLMPTAPP